MKVKMTVIAEVDDDQIQQVIDDEDQSFLDSDGEFLSPDEWEADDVDEMMTNGMMSIQKIESAEKIED